MAGDYMWFIKRGDQVLLVTFDNEEDTERKLCAYRCFLAGYCASGGDTFGRERRSLLPESGLALHFPDPCRFDLKSMSATV